MAAVVWMGGLDRLGVSVVGSIPAKLPAFELPHLQWSSVRGLMSNSFAIALLGLLEALAMAKAIAAQTGQKLDVNQQCLSEGVANLGRQLVPVLPRLGVADAFDDQSAGGGSHPVVGGDFGNCGRLHRGLVCTLRLLHSEVGAGRHLDAGGLAARRSPSIGVPLQGDQVRRVDRGNHGHLGGRDLRRVLAS